MAKTLAALLALSIVLVATCPVLCLPSGAPQEACSDLRPQHGSMAQNTTIPFELDVEMFEDVRPSNTEPTYSYKPNTTYNLVLRVQPESLAMNPSLVFRGFFIQARLEAANDSNVGGFLGPLLGQDYQLSSCAPPNTGATHVNNDPRTSVAVRWISPPVDTGDIVFRYTFVQSAVIYWENISSVTLIERRCDIPTGPYYDSPSGNCVFSCPIGFVGRFETGTCEPFPENYEASFTADVYFNRVENSLTNLSAVFNFTIVLDNSHFTTLSSAGVSIVGTSRVESIFKFLDGTLSRNYAVGSDPEVEDGGPVTVIRDHIIFINDPEQPVEADTYSFTLASTFAGSNDASPILVRQAVATGLVEVTSAASSEDATTLSTYQTTSQVNIQPMTSDHMSESTSHFANNLPTTTLEFENVTGPNDIAKKDLSAGEIVALVIAIFALSLNFIVVIFALICVLNHRRRKNNQRNNK